MLLENSDLLAPDLPNSNYSSLITIRLTTDDIKDILSIFDTNKSIGPARIHPKVLNHCVKYLTYRFLGALCVFMKRVILL